MRFHLLPFVYPYQTLNFPFTGRDRRTLAIGELARNSADR